MRIAESITRLDLGTDFKLAVRLHRENRARPIYSSLAIEGNPLSARRLLRARLAKRGAALREFRGKRQLIFEAEPSG